MNSTRSENQARSVLRERLEGRRPEIEPAVLTRINAIADTGETGPGYAEGLRSAVTAALDYAFAAIESGDERGPDIPLALLAQARLAARNGISLDMVLRRYFSGYSLFGYFVLEEASRDGLIDGPELKRQLGMQAGLFERLLAAIGEEHKRETEARRASSEQGRSERIKRLLAGELVDTSEIAYDFEARHLGVVASGPGAAEAIRRLCGPLDCRRLLVRDGDMVWAWLGSRRGPEPHEYLRVARSGGAGRAALALGESAQGLAGWRLTYRQAAAALPVAQRGPDPIVRYADVAVLASALQDDLLATSLRRLYLDRLDEDRDGGATLRRTLRAYFAAQRNSASAGAALGITRQTVNNHLRAAEERLEKPLSACAVGLEVALRLEELESGFPAGKPAAPAFSTSDERSETVAVQT